MSLSKEATENMPKKPLGVYFAFRMDKLNKYKDESKKNDKVKQDWENIDPK
jgi:hypothetical protein